MHICVGFLKLTTLNSNFKIEKEDESFISGHSVSEHLEYMINKYYASMNYERPSL